MGNKSNNFQEKEYGPNYLLDEHHEHIDKVNTRF